MGVTKFWIGWFDGREQGRCEVFQEPCLGWSPQADGSWGAYKFCTGPFATREESNIAIHEKFHGDKLPVR